MSYQKTHVDSRTAKAWMYLHTAACRYMRHAGSLKFQQAYYGVFLHRNRSLNKVVRISQTWCTLVFRLILKRVKYRYYANKRNSESVKQCKCCVLSSSTAVAGLKNCCFFLRITKFKVNLLISLFKVRCLKENNFKNYYSFIRIHRQILK